jgi:hypothetical protein
MKPSPRLVLAVLLLIAGVREVSAQDIASAQSRPATFTLRVENISSADGQLASDGSRWPFAVSPGLWVVHTEKSPLFRADVVDAGKGLEAQAEDGNPTMLAASVENMKGVKSHGIFNMPEGASEPGPVGPGHAFAFEFRASAGDRLSFAFMFGQSNDLFYSPDGNGIALFDANGQPVQGDLTAQVILWDAGTEVNQEPGIGNTQAPRQSGPNTGTAENGKVRRVNDGFTYPATANVLRIRLMAQPQ